MIDINKTYRTRDGREVRIYATDGAADGIHGAIHGAIKNERGWICTIWNKNGSWMNTGECDIDLIEVRPRHKRTVWLNVYLNGALPEACGSKEHADRNAGCNRTACIKIELDFEEGEGL